MIDDRRKKLAALAFGEKLKVLEKLRERGVMLREVREKLANQRTKTSTPSEPGTKS